MDELQIAKKELETVRNNIATELENLKSLSAETKTLEENKKQYLSDIENLQISLSEINEKIVIARGGNDRLIITKKQLEESISSLVEKKSILEKEIFDGEERNEQVKNFVLESNNIKAELVKELDSINAEISEGKKELESIDKKKQENTEKEEAINLLLNSLKEITEKYK